MTKKIINTSIIRVLFVFSAPLPLPVVVVGIINTFHVNNGLISLLFLSWSLFFCYQVRCINGRESHQLARNYINAPVIRYQSIDNRVVFDNELRRYRLESLEPVNALLICLLYLLICV